MGLCVRFCKGGYSARLVAFANTEFLSTENYMKNLRKMAAAAVLGIGTFALMASSASAAIVCNNAGYCWHVRRPWVYPAGTVIVHPDGWAPAAGVRVIWREHPGRGYWRNGLWIRF